MIYRTGIIGLGRIGFSLGFDIKREQPASHSRAFSENDRILLEGGFDIDPETMETWRKAYPSASVYISLESMLNDRKWDILIVSVPEEFHKVVMEEVLPVQPRLVVLEKPVAMSYKEALKIQEWAKEWKVPVLINHERRFSNDYRYVKDLIDSGKLGMIKTISGLLFTSGPAWHYRDGTTVRGALMRDSTHLFDAVSFLTGDGIDITYAAASDKDKQGSLPGISAIGNSGDVPTCFFIGYQTKAFEFELDIHLETGRIRIGNGLLEVYQAAESPYYEKMASLAPDPSVPHFSQTGYFPGLVSHCIDFLDGKTELLSAITDGISAMKTIDQIIHLLKVS